MHICPNCVMAAVGIIATVYAAVRAWLWRRKFNWKVHRRDRQEGCCLHPVSQGGWSRPVPEGQDHETPSSP